jgi:hypothetical protein
MQKKNPCVLEKPNSVREMYIICLKIEKKKSANTPLDNIRAATNCLAANPTMSSGAMTAISIIFSLRQ